MRLEYVLGFLMSLRQTMIRIRRVITLAGGNCFPPPVSAPPLPFGCNSAVELDPSLLSPPAPSFSLSSSPSFPAKLNSSTNSPLPAIAPASFF